MAKSLRSLTKPTDKEIIAQLNELILRKVDYGSAKGPVFLPVEILLCLSASLVIDIKKFGSANASNAPAVVLNLAHLFQRSPQSILAKINNLSGGLSHGGRFEREAAQKLLANNARPLLVIYGRILASARHVGISARRLPDFL